MRRSFVGPKDVIAIRMVFFNKRNDTVVNSFSKYTIPLIDRPEGTTKMLAIPFRKEYFHN